jgi:endogenous inhibitor of DNA gyrase (YacG/DUF329 family)
MPKSARVLCPICGRENEFFTAPTGAFCSDRCKLIDLGKWLNEEYRVSEPLRPDHFAEFEEADGDGLDSSDPK